MLEKLKGKLTNTLLTDEQKEFYKSAILAFEVTLMNNTYA